MALLDKLLGKPLANHEEEEQKVGVIAGIPMLGLDALSSAAYGPEAALTILLPLGALGLVYIGPITIIILILLALLYFSYRQTIAAYPGGGGSYTVAKENLGIHVGLLAAAALLLDYVLNVAVGISAGVGALVSALPGLQTHTLALCLFILVFITLINLRGVRESGIAFALPTYLFIGTMGVVLAIGLGRAFLSGGHPVAVAAPAPFGCTAMTGVEAVSNGVTVFAKPSVRGAQRTLTAIVVILGVLLAGIAYLSRAYAIGATDPDKPDYQSIISQLVGAVVGRGVFYYITIASVLAVLALSANTSFADFPRLCRLIAQDNFLPRAFANRGRRLVYTLGIMVLTVSSALLLTIFGGITDRLIPLFAIGAFLAFTLSQAGMVVHWRRKGGSKVRVPLLVNALGASATGIALGIILLAKFAEGAWITLLIVPAALMLFHQTRRHYDHVAEDTNCPRPLNLTGMEPPLVVVPIKTWNTISEKALRFALGLSPDIVVVHISANEAEGFQLRMQWEKYVEEPIRQAGLPQPGLMLISSPYRRLFTPLLNYIGDLKAEHPRRQIAVIIPELVETHWYQYLLHNKRAMGLKAALLLKGDQQVIVINVPWYLNDKGA
ncbi:uncharacterized protein KY384_008065 [Bacidia gigantensis]|uniref:uncharacterized protein n=1 Tax=Bacidia gigantensis TaxID=2732470 RepID=UPI001D0596D7|nr:uncharacterized protein KY384_008065 [Bacidia gigantensis]KAG8526636.1 hypothetical protein KY384_008065 [Bacidia gigantensis]